MMQVSTERFSYSSFVTHCGFLRMILLSFDQKQISHTLEIHGPGPCFTKKKLILRIMSDDEDPLSPAAQDSASSILQVSYTFFIPFGNGCYPLEQAPPRHLLIISCAFP